MDRRRTIYTGNVQGVGFRATTHSVARQFDVQGSVRNLPDGSVELIVMGAPWELDRFHAAICRELGHHIRGAESSPVGAEFGEPSGFSIRY